MSLHPVSEILDQHVTLDLEVIDRMYLNGYIGILQRPAGIAWFFREHRKEPFPSSALMAVMTTAFVKAIEQFVLAEQIPMITFAKGKRKDDIAAEFRASFEKPEGVYLVGKAQEKARVCRTEKRRNPDTGKPYPWLVESTAMVNYYYFYIIDRDFGPLFLKFCSYFPYTMKVCLNGNEWLKVQLTQKGIDYEPLDNGIYRCAEAKRAQRIANGLDADKIDRMVRKWLRRLPHPYPASDRRAGFRYELSILQAEFSRTMVLDRPETGREFFEQVIRENLDLGRPDQVQLIFERRITRSTPGRFRTRVINKGVIPSLHVDYKKSRVKEYFKEGRALRVETTINDTRDFQIGRRLANLPALREIGFQANRRLLDVQRVSHDCWIGEDTWSEVVRPVVHGEQRASGLRFDDRRVQALFVALVLLAAYPHGFRSSHLRELLAQLLGFAPAMIPRGRMPYDLRRLRLHGLIERIPKSQRFQVTRNGLRVAMFLSRTWTRLLRPGLSFIAPPLPDGSLPLHRAFRSVDKEIDRLIRENHLAA